jgi:hypothetical protein
MILAVDQKSDNQNQLQQGAVPTPKYMGCNKKKIYGVMISNTTHN